MFYTRISKVQLIILSSALGCTKNNTLRPLAQKVCAPLIQLVDLEDSAGKREKERDVEICRISCMFGYQVAVTETWRRVWGDGKIFRGPRFLKDVLFEKNFIFTAKISDDLSLVIDHEFPFLFQDFPHLLLCSMLFMTLSSQEQPLFQKRIPL